MAKEKLDGVIYEGFIREEQIIDRIYVYIYL